jgi:hypothetical protein
MSVKLDKQKQVEHSECETDAAAVNSRNRDLKLA